MNLHDYDIRYEALQEGEAIGAQQKAVDTAINFLKMKVLTSEQIATGTGLPIEKVLELQKSLE